MKNWKASLIFKSHCSHSETRVDVCVGRNSVCQLWVAWTSNEYGIPQAGHPVFKVLKMTAHVGNNCAEQSQALWAALISSWDFVSFKLCSVWWTASLQTIHSISPWLKPLGETLARSGHFWENFHFERNTTLRAGYLNCSLLHVFTEILNFLPCSNDAEWIIRCNMLPLWALHHMSFVTIAFWGAGCSGILLS